MALVQYDSEEEQEGEEREEDQGEAIQEITTSPKKFQSGAVPRKSNLLTLPRLEEERDSPTVTQGSLRQSNVHGQARSSEVASLSESLPAPKNKFLLQQKAASGKTTDGETTKATLKIVKHDSVKPAEQCSPTQRLRQRNLFSIKTDSDSRASQSGFTSTDVAYEPVFDHDTQAIPTSRSSKQVRSTDGLEDQSQPSFIHPSDQYKYNPDLVYASDVNASTSFTAQAKPPKRRKTQDIPLVMQDIDADERYMDNLRYMQSDERKEEHAPVRFVGTGKHQLSSLLNSAMAQKDSLESSFATQKRSMRDSKAKYGR